MRHICVVRFLAILTFSAALISAHSEVALAENDPGKKATGVLHNSLEKARTNHPKVWRNKKNNTSFTITITNTKIMPGGAPCRKYEIEAQGKKGVYLTKGGACREDDGKWRIVTKNTTLTNKVPTAPRKRGVWLPSSIDEMMNGEQVATFESLGYRQGRTSITEDVGFNFANNIYTYKNSQGRNIKTKIRKRGKQFCVFSPNTKSPDKVFGGRKWLCLTVFSTITDARERAAPYLTPHPVLAFRIVHRKKTVYDVISSEHCKVDTYRNPPALNCMLRKRFWQKNMPFDPVARARTIRQTNDANKKRNLEIACQKEMARLKAARKAAARRIKKIRKAEAKRVAEAGRKLAAKQRRERLASEKREAKARRAAAERKRIAAIAEKRQRDEIEAERKAREETQKIRMAAEQGDAVAQERFADRLTNGIGIAKNNAAALKWLRNAAEQGNAKVQERLGNWLADGKEVPKNNKEAVRWFRKAAEQGKATAQVRLGNMLTGGMGASKDDTEAAIWYRKAAEQGHANAQFTLANVYSKGLGIPQNEEEARVWYRKAALQGIAEAQFIVGNWYLDDLGVPRSEAERLRWFRKAAYQGHTEAAEAVKVIEAAIVARNSKNLYLPVPPSFDPRNARSFITWRKQRLHRAYVISPGGAAGWTSGAASRMLAESIAMGGCRREAGRNFLGLLDDNVLRRNQNKCTLIAVDRKIVGAKPRKTESVYRNYGAGSASTNGASSDAYKIIEDRRKAFSHKSVKIRCLKSNDTKTIFYKPKQKKPYCHHQIITTCFSHEAETTLDAAAKYSCRN